MSSHRLSAEKASPGLDLDHNARSGTGRDRPETRSTVTISFGLPGCSMSYFAGLDRGRTRAAVRPSGLTAAAQAEATSWTGPRVVVSRPVARSWTCRRHADV